MASRCSQIFQQSSIGALKSATSKPIASLLNRSTMNSSTRPSLDKAALSPLRRLSLSRVGKRGVNASTAQRCGHRQNDVVSEFICLGVVGLFLRVLNEDLRLVLGQQERMINGANVWNLPVTYDKLGVRYRLWRDSVEQGSNELS